MLRPSGHWLDQEMMGGLLFLFSFCLLLAVEEASFVFSCGGSLSFLTWPVFLQCSTHRYRSSLYLHYGEPIRGECSFGSVLEKKVMKLDINIEKAKGLMREYREGRLEVLDFVAGASSFAKAFVQTDSSDNSSINLANQIIHVKNAKDFRRVYTNIVSDSWALQIMLDNGRTSNYDFKNYESNIIIVSDSTGQVVAPVIENQTNNSTSESFKSFLLGVITVVVVGGVLFLNKDRL